VNWSGRDTPPAKDFLLSHAHIYFTKKARLIETFAGAKRFVEESLSSTISFLKSTTNPPCGSGCPVAEDWQKSP